MEKAKKIFIDGEVTRYTFAKGNYVSISCINTGKGWLGNLYWKIEKYKNPIFGYPSIANKHKTKNIAKLTETINLYNSIKKTKIQNRRKKTTNTSINDNNSRY